MQRKLNTRFLVILTVVVVGGLLVLVVGGKYLFRGTAQKCIQMAELYTRENRLADAAEEYKKAIALDRRNPEVYLKTGEVMRLLTRADPTMVDKDKAYWNMALEADPSYLPAMQKLLEAHLEDAQLWPNPTTFGRVRDICSRILAVDPTDSRAKTQLHIAWIQSWLAGVETSPQQIEESLRELAALQEKDPSNLDAPFVYARGKINRANQLQAQQLTQEAANSLAQAESMMQAVTAANPDSPRAFLRAGQILMEMSTNAKQDNARRKSYRVKGAAEITRAQELLKNDDSAFLEVNMAAALVAHQDHKVEQAEKIYRDILARYPDDRGIRIALAQLLVSDPSKRQDAISLLEDSVNDDQSLIGARVRLRADMQIRTQMVLAGLRIDALAAAKTEQEKSELHEKINGHLTEIYNRQGESPEYLRLKGRLYQAQNQYVDAIQTYNRAVAMLAQLGRPQDDDMMYQLARVYIAAQQTGEARNILEDLTRKYDSFIPARILLCRVLLAEGSRDKAIPHLRFLEQNAPDDPQVTALLLASASQKQDSAKTKELLDQMPEGSREEKLAKARAAMEAGQTDAAQRLSGELLTTTPGDEEAVQIAVQMLAKQNQPDAAAKVVQAALAVNPDSRNLKMMRAQLEGGEQLVEALQENVDKIADEFMRELAKARLADATNKPEQVLPHLQKAESIKPDSPELWDQMFQYYAREKSWDKLQPYMTKLTAANHDRAGGLLYQFRLLMAKGEVEQAVETGRQLTVKLPEFAQSWLALAQGLQSARKYDEAREAYLRVLEKQAMNMDAYRGLAETCYQLRRPDDAGRHIADALKRMPNNTILRNMEMEHELNFGRPEKVIGTLESLAAKMADKRQAWSDLGRAYALILQRKAPRGDEEAGKWAKKLRDHYQRALEKWPEDSEFAARYADACVILNDRPAAEKILQQHFAKVGGKPQAAIMLADFYLRGGEAAHSEETLKKALESHPAEMILWERLAAVQWSAGRADDAIKTLDNAPNQDQVLMQKLEFMLNAGKIKEAKEMIQGALKARGEDFGLVNAQAYIALQENDLAGARAFAEKSLTLKPNNPIALHQRAVAKLRDARPDLEGAIVDLKVALQQAPTNVELRLAAAEAYVRRRDPSSAIRELEIAANVAPRNPNVWRKLIEMYLDSTPPRLDDARNLVDLVRAAGGEDLDLAVRAAKVAQLKRDPGLAIAEMRRVISMSNNDPKHIRDYMVMLLDLEQYEHLLKESELLLQQAPDVWWIRHVRAIAKARMGTRDDALQEWGKALEIADKAHDENGSLMIMEGLAKEVGVSQVMPRVLERAKQEPRWIIFAAWLYQSENDWKNAVLMVDKAVAVLEKLSKEEQLRALKIAGGVYMMAQPTEADKALKAYNRLLEISPDDMGTLNNIACLYMDLMNPSNPAKAVEYSQRAYDSMRKRGIIEPLIMDTHGWLLANTGKVQDGIVLLQEVVQRKADLLDARYHLSEAYLKGNFADAAVRQLTEANKLIAELDAKRASVDPALKARIEQAMARAVTLAKEQAAAAK